MERESRDVSAGRPTGWHGGMVEEQESHSPLQRPLTEVFYASALYYNTGRTCECGKILKLGAIVRLLHRERFFLVEPKSCFHAGDFVARRGAIASICAGPAGFVAQPDSCRLPSIPVDSALGRLGATRACERGRVREGPRTNAKSKCSETRPMGAGRRQIESVALCVWQCHLRNISTLSNRTHYRCQRRCKRKT